MRHVENDEVEVEITLAREAGARLRADRSINLPDSVVERPPLLPKDLQDLDFVADCADMVGLSFAESAEGILELSQALRDRTSRTIGIVLKIETQIGRPEISEEEGVRKIATSHADDNTSLVLPHSGGQIR